MNNRLDSHDRQITRTEKFKMSSDCKVEGGADKTPSASARCLPRGGSGGHRYYRDNYNDDGHGRHPCHPGLKFPCYDGESDRLPWLNKCDGFFWGH